MSEFQGFPARMMFTPLPNLVFSSIMPQISDIAELKLLLHIFEIVYPKKGHLKFTSLDELLVHPSIVADFQPSPREALPGLLASLSGRKILLHLGLKEDGRQEELYFLNSDANRLAVSKIQSGEFKIDGLKAQPPPTEITPRPPDIFTLYEQNIGLLTPLIADSLRDAEKQYPESWIADAIRQAVSANKRNWRYIARILERWATEGKDDGTHRGNLKANTDPDKYIRGKYGHLVQR
jgi:DNA replication protein